MQDGPLLGPVPLRLDGKALEKLALALEKRLQRGDGERLPESTRAVVEELLPRLAYCHGIKRVRLVDVRKATVSQL